MFPFMQNRPALLKVSGCLVIIRLLLYLNFWYFAHRDFFCIDITFNKYCMKILFILITEFIGTREILCLRSVPYLPCIVWPCCRQNRVDNLLSAVSFFSISSSPLHPCKIRPSHHVKQTTSKTNSALKLPLNSVTGGILPSHVAVVFSCLGIPLTIRF